MPLISLVMPMRNARPYVTAALRSVLGQQGVDLDVIVVDDGSTDGSAHAVRAIGDRRLRLIQGRQTGIAAAMNAGIEAAAGDLLCRCDADDLYPPGRLARQADWLATHTDFAAISGCFATLAPNGEPIMDLPCGPVAEEVTAELATGKTRTHLCTYLIRTAALKRIGGFRPWFVTAEDTDLQLRLGGAFRVWYDPAVCYHYRLHGQSITHQQSNVHRLFYENSARRFAFERRESGVDALERACPPAPPAAHANAAAGDAGSHVYAMLLGASWRQHRAGRKLHALRTGLRACFARPHALSAWWNLAALAVRPAGESDSPTPHIGAPVSPRPVRPITGNAAALRGPGRVVGR